METRSFLQTQLRILDTPIQLEQAEAPARTDDSITPALLLRPNDQVNAAIRKHNRSAYPLEASGRLAGRTNAEWQTKRAEGETTASTIEMDFDVLNDDTFDALPAEWVPKGAGSDSGLEGFAESAKYSKLRNQLGELKESIKSRQTIVSMLEQLVILTDPFENPAASLQGDLATRDGPLAAEIARMKVLLAQSRGRG